MPRQTRSQRLILDMLEQRSQPMSAQEIFIELRNLGTALGLATVYRSLESLQTQGHLQAINLGDHQSYYQVLPKSGHNQHHLICTHCRKVIPLPSCPVGDLEDKLSDTYHFAIDYHVLDFYGTCQTCRG